MKKINIYKSVENLKSVYIDHVDPRKRLLLQAFPSILLGTLPNELIELYMLKYYFNLIRNIIIETQLKRIKVE